MNLTEVMYCGIDIGLRGGISIITEDLDSECIEVFPYSDEKLMEILKRAADSYCKIMVEKQWARKGQGISSMFNLGESYGYVRGAIEAFQVSYELVSPQTWKKEFGVTSDKQTSIDTAKRLFPRVNLLPTDRSRKDSDGIAESLLLAEYCRRKNRRKR